MMKKKRKHQKRKSDWKKWEELAYAYVKDLLGKDEIIFSCHTQESHDGGADAIYILNKLNDIGASMWCLALMEAKYRQNESSLSLDDCAKSMIIAFNRRADDLYIVTNIPISNQAIENAYQTRSYSSLNIIFVTAHDMKGYIDRKRKPLSENNKIDSVFLDCVYEQLKKCEETVHSYNHPISNNCYVEIDSWEVEVEETIKKYYLDKNNTSL